MKTLQQTFKSVGFIIALVYPQFLVADTANDKTEIASLFDNYMQTYNSYLTTRDMPSQQSLYSKDILFMSTGAGPTSMPSEQFYAQITGFLDRLSASGVAEVEWQDVNIKLLSETVALASNVAVRYKRNGDVHNRVGATYLLKKQPDGWRISSFAVHNAETAITL